MTSRGQQSSPCCQDLGSLAGDMKSSAAWGDGDGCDFRSAWTVRGGGSGDRDVERSREKGPGVSRSQCCLGEPFDLVVLGFLEGIFNNIN